MDCIVSGFPFTNHEFMQDTINNFSAVQSGKIVCRRTNMVGRSLIRNFINHAEPQVSSGMRGRSGGLAMLYIRLRVWSQSLAGRYN